MAKQLRRRAARSRFAKAIECWLGNHGRAVVETLDRLIRTPLSTAMTVAAIAIALALPATLFVVLDNLERLGGGWQRSAGLSLFLTPEVDEARAAELAAELRARADISVVELISADRGLAEFREYSGLGGALDQLSQNPLPVVLAIHPAPRARNAEALKALAASLETRPEADFARLDSQWTERFNAMIALLNNAALLLAVVLGLAVLLVVGNTIRLEIENRRGEVQIMDLVGATPGFIRRPFLYSGAWYGLLGGMIAWIMVSLSIYLLQEPVDRLATLYHTEFALDGIGPIPTLALLS
ncbi:MAG: permease-like cell division protein FtsX, partial [Thiohalocapsa sp.]